MPRNLQFAAIPLALIFVWAIPSWSPGAEPMSDSSSHSSITHAPFGQTTGGTSVDLYTLRNRHGMEARIATYGGTVTSLTAPDRQGHYADVVLGYDTLPEYFKGTAYFGAMIGRYGNRIAHGQFTLDGTKYTLATNNGAELAARRAWSDSTRWSGRSKEPSVGAQGPQLALTLSEPRRRGGVSGQSQGRRGLYPDRRQHAAARLHRRHG